MGSDNRLPHNCKLSIVLLIYTTNAMSNIVIFPNWISIIFEFKVISMDGVYQSEYVTFWILIKIFPSPSLLFILS